jgi:hypothetical protein
MPSASLPLGSAPAALARWCDDQPRRAALACVPLLALLCWLSFFLGLGDLGLMDKTEALFVEVARQMLERGDWVVPWWNGEHFFDYPVWGYWMVALAFRCFGLAAGVARLPVALAASTVVVAVFLLLQALAPPAEAASRRLGRGLLAAAVLATSPGWIGWGRSATTDMFLSSAITLALVGFLLADRLPEASRWSRLGRVLLPLFCGIAVLAKGPVGVLLPGLVIVAFLALQGGWARWWRPGRLLAMLLLFLGVCLPWYVAAARAEGMAFVGGFLGFSNLQRFTSVLYDHPGPPWFYLPWLLLLLLPWSLYLPVAIAAALPQLRRRPAGSDPTALPGQPLPLFLLLWLGLMVAFFSAAATKLPGYILPALPAGSLLVALHWLPLAPQGAVAPAGRGMRWSGWCNAGLLALLAAAAVVAPRWAADDPAFPGFAAALAASGLPLRLGLLLALAALALVLLLRRPGGGRWLWLPDLLGFLALLPLVIAPLAPLLDRERQLPLRQLAALASQQARPDEPLWVLGTKRYSMVFYTGAPAAFVSGRGRIAERLREDPASLGLTPASRSVRIFGDRPDLEELELPPARVERLGRRGEQELWRVQRQDLQP